MKLLDYQAGELAEKLQVYLSKDASYKAVYEYTQLRFEAAPELTAHNWEHCYRDTLNAIVIGEAEGADMSVVLPAITMHDIGFLYGATGRTHGAVGADKLSEYLSQGGIEYPADTVGKIAECIRTHKGSMHDEKPESLEAKVVADADLLEKFGFMGLYQTMRTCTEFNWSLDTLLERGEGMANLTLETATGQKLAEPGMQVAVDFYNQLKKAAEPYQDKV